MKCTNCGNEITPGSSFCVECGAPVPKMKLCIKCGKELPVEAKFCPECGTSQTETSEHQGVSGLDMGDKNVIAGDVSSTVNNNQQTHHNETITTTTNNTTVNNTTNNTTVNNTTNNTTNTTNINIRDDTREANLCALCGKHTIKVQGYTCTSCGSFVCANDFNKDYKVCKKCSGEHVTSNGKISSFQVFKDKYTAIEATRPSRNMIFGLSSLKTDTSITRLVSLVESFEIPENSDEIIKFLNFARSKISAQRNAISAMTAIFESEALVEAFKDKIAEIKTEILTMGFTPSQLKAITKVANGCNNKRKKQWTKMIVLIIVFFVFMIFIYPHLLRGAGEYGSNIRDIMNTYTK